MPYVDFQEIKRRVSIEDAARMLNLKLEKSGNQYRGACPACRSGGPRALAITPGKSAFYCFALGKGGDQIALVAHIQGINQREAAELMSEHFHVTSPAPDPQETRQEARVDGLPALDYLEADHEAVEAVGFDPETAQALGIGFASKGIMRGLVAVPIRLEDGTIAGYIGISEARLPTRWHIPQSNIVPLRTSTRRVS